jgi:hypothetical protein
MSAGDSDVWVSKIFLLNPESRYQVFDVTYINYQGKTYHEADLGSKTAIEIPEGEHCFIQFMVPERTVLGDEAQVQIKSQGAMDYYRTIPVTLTPPVSVEFLSQKTYNLYVHRYKIESMKSWMPSYILI